ncbi:protein CBFA2T1-like isoform X2 [Hydractinia symbiolongicarpus]|uniref:protein CBFA2T1-like isoform X2 n=1 Tax=Hydractinia symbiolongicarpus TaxID=13093 RepID=UPI00254DD195|nr:protein CBFA2T1-like isoform X2 [Hydractinia symbiolongicarpus]XP_057291258.1 protein CBFA2T1-like isoform X2 [Hydractinia symbiolongicarpus]
MVASRKNSLLYRNSELTLRDYMSANERSVVMPDSPVPVPADAPIVSSPARLHITTSTSQLIDGRPPISVATGLPNGYHATSPNQPLSPGLLNGMQLPPTCGARQLSKLKRFLTTLQQFGSDISPEIGERVRGLIVNLVNNAITVEEFHQQLQDATNFPLRPFVIPFLKANLPLLQQELIQCSHLSKRSPHQYLTPSESLSAHERERIKSEGEEFGFDRVGEKRKSDAERPKENGHHNEAHGLPAISPNKRKCRTPGYDQDSGTIVEQLMDSMKQDTDEWRNLETILQCIVTFVEKAKRSMSVLQDRCVRDREEMASWARAMAADAESEIKRRAVELTDDRINEVKRRAEDAVTDVKRKAVVELQKAVSAAEEKANDALSQAHQRMDKAVLEARRQATEETSIIINQQENSKENCWNCGRKANETCSGCNVARYCGAFCQHKDWEHHHKECGKHAKQSQESNSKSPRIETDSSTPDRKSSPRPVTTATTTTSKEASTSSTEAVMSTPPVPTTST